MKSFKSEYEEILSVLVPKIPKKILGKDAILQMKNSGSSNWRQMEWIGFWFEEIVNQALSNKLGESGHSQYGKTKFDFVRNHTWDLKVHPNQSKSLILNDLSAIEQCLNTEGGLGFIVLSGDVEYDVNSTFKKWHDDLKGGVSTYEKDRVKRQAPSRRRKVSFTPTVIEGFWFNSFSEIESCLSAGILAEFQTGMRNSNGVARLPKIAIKKIDGLASFAIGRTKIA